MNNKIRIVDYKINNIKYAHELYLIFQKVEKYTRVVIIADVDIMTTRIITVKMPFYISTGTNDGKIGGDVYPIMGIYHKDFNKLQLEHENLLINFGVKTKEMRDHWFIKSPFYKLHSNLYDMCINPYDYVDTHNHILHEKLQTLKCYGFGYTKSSEVIKEMSMDIKNLILKGEKKNNIDFTLSFNEQIAEENNIFDLAEIWSLMVGSKSLYNYYTIGDTLV